MTLVTGIDRRRGAYRVRGSSLSTENDLQTTSVGIAMRTKDRPVLLRRALHSVKAQSWQNWRLIVVNDSGDPGPVEALVSDVFDEDARVKIIHRKVSRGMEAATNAALEILETDLAVVHDDDDTWAPTMVEAAVSTLLERQKRFPTIRGVVVNVEAVFETVSGEEIRTDFVHPWKASPGDALSEGFVDLAKLLIRNQFPPIAFIFELSACNAIGGYDESLAVLGDWDFHLRFCAAHDIWIHTEYLARYHHRPKETGTLGNSIFAGLPDHMAYRGLLRNKWLREALAGSGASAPTAVMLRHLAERLDQVDGTVADLRQAASEKRRKRGLARRISGLFRW